MNKFCNNKHFQTCDDYLFCPLCGEVVDDCCTLCGAPYELMPYDIWPTDEPIPANYCPYCGNPYPWTIKILENAIALLSLDDNLDQETKNIISQSFPDLLTYTPKTELAIARYKKFVPRLESNISNALRDIFVNVISESISKKLFG